ncbi:MAG: SRPBCC domain-containing protein [Rhodothermales bacterium]
MERKTQVHAEDDRQELVITRDFDLPVDLLFRAYVEPEIVEQWMGTRVVRLENWKGGSWQFETSDRHGVIAVRMNGVFHAYEPDRTITRTFEMENTPFGAQLEFLEFESLSEDTSRLTMHIVFRSTALRNQLLQMPFASGINMAHNRLQTVAGNLR